MPAFKCVSAVLMFGLGLQLCCWGLEYVPVWQKLMRTGDKVSVPSLTRSVLPHPLAGQAFLRNPPFSPGLTTLGAGGHTRSLPTDFAPSIYFSQCLYWIQPTDPSLYPIPADEPFNLLPGSGPPPPDLAFQPIGHVALDREDYLDPPNKLLASRETGSVMLASLFILKSQQGRGLGNKVLAMAEDEARRLGAPQIALDT